MDWKRFKKIIIIVLVMINIVFSIYYLHIKISDNNVNRETRENVISVLGKSNIILDKKLFPDNMKTYSACYVSRLISKDSAFAQKIKGEKGEMAEEDELFTVTGISSEPIELTEKNVVDACIKHMNECGINAEMYKAETVEISEKSAKVRFNLTFGNGVFFDSFIDFDLNEKGITRLLGRNIIKAEENMSAYEEELMPLESIIVAIPKDRKTEKPLEISDINFGYYLGKSAGVYVSVLSLPVWKITFEDNTFLYYDARNGNLINIS